MPRKIVSLVEWRSFCSGCVGHEDACVHVTLLDYLSLAKHPPYGKSDATEYTDGTQNEHDNKCLAYGSVERRQRSTSPVDPM